jgi:hypothetical protein
MSGQVSADVRPRQPGGGDRRRGLGRLVPLGDAPAEMPDEQVRGRENQPRERNKGCQHDERDDDQRDEREGRNDEEEEQRRLASR